MEPTIQFEAQNALQQALYNLATFANHLLKISVRLPHFLNYVHPFYLNDGKGGLLLELFTEYVVVLIDNLSPIYPEESVAKNLILEFFDAAL